MCAPTGTVCSTVYLSELDGYSNVSTSNTPQPLHERDFSLYNSLVSTALGELRAHRRTPRLSVWLPPSRRASRSGRKDLVCGTRNREMIGTVDQVKLGLRKPAGKAVPMVRRHRCIGSALENAGHNV